MKKIIIMTALLCATALALNGTPLWDEMATVCEQTADGGARCLDFSFQYNVPVRFEENVFCYSNESAGFSGTISACYSTVTLTKAETFELVYVLGNESGKSYEHVNRTYLPMNYTTFISPSAIDVTRCPAAFNEVIQLYEFECPYSGRTINADLAPGLDDTLMIAALEGGIQITTELIVYIVLGAIIILLIYSAFGKKK